MLRFVILAKTSTSSGRSCERHVEGEGGLDIVLEDDTCSFSFSHGAALSFRLITIEPALDPLHSTPSFFPVPVSRRRSSFLSCFALNPISLLILKPALATPPLSPRPRLGPTSLAHPSALSPHRIPSRQSYRAKIDSVRTRTWLDGSRLVEQRIGVLVNENGIVVISAVKDWQLTHVLR